MPDSESDIFVTPLQSLVTPIKTPSSLGVSSPTVPFHLTRVDPLHTPAMGRITSMPIAGQGHYYTPSPTAHHHSDEAVDHDDEAVDIDDEAVDIDDAAVDLDHEAVTGHTSPDEHPKAGKLSYNHVL